MRLDFGISFTSAQLYIDRIGVLSYNRAFSTSY
jgi:hypothetical protein